MEQGRSSSKEREKKKSDCFDRQAAAAKGSLIRRRLFLSSFLFRESSPSASCSMFSPLSHERREQCELGPGAERRRATIASFVRAIVKEAAAAAASVSLWPPPASSSLAARLLSLSLASLYLRSWCRQLAIVAIERLTAGPAARALRSVAKNDRSSALPAAAAEKSPPPLGEGLALLLLWALFWISTDAGDLRERWLGSLDPERPETDRLPRRFAKSKETSHIIAQTTALSFDLPHSSLLTSTRSTPTTSPPPTTAPRQPTAKDDAKAAATKAAKAVKKNTHKRGRKICTSVVFHRPKTLQRSREPKFARKVALGAPRIDEFDVIKFPLTTESAMKKIEDNNTLVFVVDARADKRKIKAAVAALYDVAVAKVNTLVRPDGAKKAYVRLTPDYDALDVANKIGII